MRNSTEGAVYLNGHLCQEDHSENVVGHSQKQSLLKVEVRLIIRQQVLLQVIYHTQC